MKRLVLSLLAVATLAYAACNASKEDVAKPGRTAYLDLPAETHQYYGDPSMDNIATLGRVLFYERNLSVNGTVSCGSCHKQNLAFADDVAFSRGFQDRLTGRNTPALQDFTTFFMNGGPTSRFFWDGRSDNLNNLIGGPVTNHIEMGLQHFEDVLPGLRRLDYYPPLFQAAFGTSEITTDRISYAVSLFLAAIRTGHTRFDDYNRFQGSLSALEMQGEHLFQTKYNCAGCHNENMGGYTGNAFADIGLEQTPNDMGLGAISGDPSENGLFKIPNLRNVTLTAPYMHDGRFETLDDVLEHYSHGIQPAANLDVRLQDLAGAPMRMNILPEEKAAIIAFLGTLTDPVMTTDPYLSDPFKLH